MLLKKPAFTFQIGLVFFLLSTFFGFFAPRTHLVSENRVDGIRGFLIGTSIALLLVSIRARAGGRSAR